MGELTSLEQICVEAASATPMLAQVECWAALNSGSRNLAGLDDIAGRLADAFADLPGDVELVAPAPVEAVDAGGKNYEVPHGRNLHLGVRPDAPVQLLFTGHMDTVFGVDHEFQSLNWLEPGKVLNGPGVADMKGGIAVMLAALKAVEASPLASVLGYEVVINSDEEVGSLGSASLIARSGARQAGCADLRTVRTARRNAGRRQARKRQFRLHHKWPFGPCRTQSRRWP